MIMKHPGFVFGLASLVTACAAQPRHPLCNGDGSPACGNIGQRGRVDAPNVRAMHAVLGASVEIRDSHAQPEREPAFVVTRPAMRAPTPRPSTREALPAPRPSTREAVPPKIEPPMREARLTHRTPLLAFATSQLASQLALADRPRLTADDDVAVGNVMGKGKPHRPRPRQALLAAPEQPTLEVKRPRVTDDDDFAVGNMTEKR
jgi:hypothetical protein